MKALKYNLLTMNIQDLESMFSKKDWVNQSLSVEVFAEQWFLGELEHQAGSPNLQMRFSLVKERGKELLDRTKEFSDPSELIASLHGHAYRFDLASFRNCW